MSNNKNFSDNINLNKNVDKFYSPFSVRYIKPGTKKRIGN